MCRSRGFILVLVLLAGGCAKESTAQLIDNLKSPDSLTRLKAVRTLPERTQDAAQVIPALIETLKDENVDIRRSAAFGLGTFGEQAKDAVPTLQASLRDREPSVRKAAAQSLKHIAPGATKAEVHR